MKTNLPSFKAIAFAFFLIFSGFLSAQAQVSNYTFSQSAGTFTFVSPPAGTKAAFANGWDDDFSDAAIGAPYTIPFTFTYNGIACTHAIISANGYVILGDNTLTTGGGISYGDLFNNSGTDNNCVAPWNTDMQQTNFATFTGTRTNGSPTITGASSTTNIKIGMNITGNGIPAQTIITNIVGTTVTMSQNATSNSSSAITPKSTAIAFTTGSAPNRKFIVQFTRCKRYTAGTSGNGDDWTFQIILNEAGGVSYNQTVQVVYGTFTTTNGAGSVVGLVGLKGGSTSDFNSRTETSTWTGTTAGASNTDNCFLSNTVFPPSGRTFTWTPPAPCSGTPTPGTTLSTANPVCSGVSFTLSLSGATVASGITYQWQSSANGSSWSDIGGATSSTLTTSQTTATYYRCKVICSISSLFAFSTSLQITMNAPTNCYCQPNSSFGTSGGSYGVISNVTLNTLNNSSTYPASSPYYTNYAPAGSTTTTLLQGNAYTISVSSGVNDQVAVWCDWDQSGTFDPGEFTYLGTNNSGSAWTGSATINVPPGATLGNTRIRVRSEYYFYTLGSGDACTQLVYGESEDYTITIAVPPPCSGTPTAGTATASPASISCGSSSLLSLPGATTGVSGLTYQWQSSTVSGGPYTNIGGATSYTYTANPIVNTFYICQVGCSSVGGGSATSAEGSLTITAPIDFSVAVSANPTALCPGGNSQFTGNVTQQLIIGNGTVQNTNITYPTPFGAYYTGSHEQYLVLASELTAAGLTAGNINSLSFDMAASYTYGPMQNFQIQIAPTALSALTTTLVNSGFTSVYTNASYLPGTGTGWTTFTFGTPFSWNGTSNIVIDVMHMNCTTCPTTSCTDYTNNGVVNQSATSFVSCNYANDDADCSISTFTPSAVSTISQRPNMQFGQATGTFNYTWTPSTFLNNAAIASPLATNVTATTAYTLVVTKPSNGCTVSGNVTLTVDPLVLAPAATPVAGSYCTPIFSAGSDYDYITSFQLNSINNTTGNVYGSASYTYYTPAPTTSLTAGSTYTLTLATGGFNNEYTNLWIDFNDDGTFSASEQLLSDWVNTPGTSSSTNVLIPGAARNGLHRMRIRETELAGLDACSDAGFNYGEAEDYDVTITGGTAPNCGGITNYTLDAGVTGGGQPYSYSWTSTPAGFTSSAANPVVNPLVSTTYHVQITDFCGTVMSASTGTITVLPAPTVSVSPTTATICSGSAGTGLTASGASTYFWSPVTGLSASTGSNVTASPSLTTTYTVSGVSAGCAGTATSTITVYPVPYVGSVSASPAGICPGSTTQMQAVTTSTSYCTPTSDCTFPDIITNVTLSTINNSTACGNSTTGYSLYSTPNPTLNVGTTYPFSVTTDGDVEGIAIWIDFNQNGLFETSELLYHGFLNTTPATYTGSITIPAGALNGATRMRVRDVYDGDPISLSPTDPSCTSVTYGETEDYSVTIAGGVNYTFTWTPAGSFVNNAVANPTTVALNNTTTFNVQVSNGTCFTTASGTAYVNSMNFTSAIATPATVCPGTNTSTLSVAATSTAYGNPQTYCTPVYTTGSGGGTDAITNVQIVGTTLNNSSGATNSPYYITYPQLGSTTATLTAGQTYTVSVTGGTNANCFVRAWIDYDLNGTLASSESIGGTASSCGSSIPVTFTFTVPVTAYNGDTRLRFRSQRANLPGTNAACTSIARGEDEDYIITITGGQAAPVSLFSWAAGTYLNSTSGASVTATNIPSAQTYTVTGTSVVGCTASTTVTENVFTPPVPTVTATNPICAGSSLSVGSNAYNSYSWTGPNGFTSGAQNALVTNTASTANNGTYTVSVVDGNGCSGSNSVSVSVLANTLSANVSVTAYNCNNNTGTLLFTVSGGLAPYTMSPSTVLSGNTITLTGQAAGPHTYTFTDANGCIATVNTTLNSQIPAVGTVTADQIVCSNNTFSGSLSSAAGNLISWQSSNSNAGPWTTVGTNTLSFTSGPLLTGTTYYRVVASTPGCVSMVSNSVRAIVDETPAGASASGVTDVSAVVTVAGANGSAFPTYNLTWTGGGSASNVTLPYTINGLTSGTTYTVNINYAPNSCGTTAAQTTFTTICNSPVLSATLVNNTHVSLSWTTAPAATDSILYRNVLNAPWHAISPAVNPYTLSTTYGTTYAAYVKHWCGGNYINSPVIYFTTTGSLCNGLVPTLQSLTPLCATRMTATWNNTGASAYKISIRRTSPTVYYGAFTNIVGTSYTFSTLPGASYEVVVQGLCASNNPTPASIPMTATAPDLLPPPDNVVTSAQTCAGFTMSWTPVPGALNYHIKYTVNGATNTLTTPTNANTYTFYAPSGVVYQVSVATNQSCSPTNIVALGLYGPTVNGQSLVCKDGEVQAVSKDNNLSEVKVFPNPNSGQFNVSFDNALEQPVNYSVVNLLGQTVYMEDNNEPAGSVSHTISLRNDLASGLYYLSIKTGNQVITRQVMVTR